MKITTVGIDLAKNIFGSFEFRVGCAKNASVNRPMFAELYQR
jgi:hypothetical protein